MAIFISVEKILLVPAWCFYSHLRENHLHTPVINTLSNETASV